jgi:serine beta-lactamase-like protein LACTB
LAKTVQSLNRTEIVYEPESRTKYSNAAIATVGFVLEETQKKAFPRYLQQTLLEPLGMKHSSFEPDPVITKDLAKGVMWTYQGREFPAPTFELGEAPAGCLYTNVTDLGHFLSVLLARGKGPNGIILKPESVEEMWKPQFAKPEDKERKFGLGFVVGDLDGKRRLGHGGAIYGFATELEFLPDEKLGVVVVASRDVANGVTNRIAEVALQQMLAAKASKPLPKIDIPTKVKPELARKLPGRWRSDKKAVDFTESNGTLWALPVKGGIRTEIRALDDHTLIMDDRQDYGAKIEIKGDKLVVGKDEYEREVLKQPEPAPAKWLGLIGEYGWDHNILYVFEKDGKLQTYIEWAFIYPLEEEKADVFMFPDFGLYHGEKLVFTRDKNGRATQVEAAGVIFERRKIDGENGETFKIKPQRPVEELRKEALAAKPPPEKGDFRDPALVELVKLDDTIKLDIRYATTNNFLSTPFYTSAKAYMQKPAAEALVRVHKKLEKEGYGLLVFDGYRPWSVTKMFWDATPEKQHLFVADPAKGSRHNRGCAVDLTLYDRKTGKPVAMVGGYDEMSDRSYPHYVGGTSLQRWHRDLLRRAMEAEGFTVYEAEWWHFDYKDWKQYAIQNQTFEQLK